MIATLKTKLQSKIANDKHFAELVKGSGIALALRVVGIIAGYTFTLLVTRTLGAEAWGIFSLSLVVLQITSVIGKLGMDVVLLKFTAEHIAKEEISALRDIYGRIFILVVFFSVLVAICVYFLSPILASKIFHKPYLGNYFRVVSFMVVPFVLLLIHTEGIRGFGKIKEYILLQQIGVFCIAITVFLVGLSCFKSYFLPLVSYGVSVFWIALFSIFLWYKYLFHFPSYSNSSNFSGLPSNCGSLFSISMTVFLSGFLNLIVGWMDIIILALFRNSQEVGIYSVVLRISMMINITLSSINTIVAPKFAELWGRGNIRKLQEIAQQSTKLAFGVSSPMLMLFILFPEYILRVFGEEFGKETLVLVVLGIGQFINVVSGSVGYILQMTDKQGVYRNVILSAVIVNILLGFSLISKFGILGAAIVNFVTITFINVVSTIVVWYYYGFCIICDLFSSWKGFLRRKLWKETNLKLFI